MNVYTMAYCSTCDSLEQVGCTLSVHGVSNREEAERMYKEGWSLEAIWKHFCSHCGGYIDDGDCGCGNCIPQQYFEGD